MLNDATEVQQVRISEDESQDKREDAGSVRTFPEEQCETEGLEARREAHPPPFTLPPASSSSSYVILPGDLSQRFITLRKRFMRRFTFT